MPTPTTWTILCVFDVMVINIYSHFIQVNAIGTSAQGTMVVLCNYGALRSQDRGATWTHLHEQFRQDTAPSFTGAASTSGLD